MRRWEWDCETYSLMAEEAEPYFPPTEQQHQHRILIYHANGLLGHRLVEYFRNDHIIELNPNLIIGTIDPTQKYANDLGLTLEIDVRLRPLRPRTARCSTLPSSRAISSPSLSRRTTLKNSSICSSVTLASRSPEVPLRLNPEKGDSHLLCF